MDEDSIWYAEPMEYIRKCLSCQKPECSNCLERQERKRSQNKRVVQYSADRLTLIAVYDSVPIASEELNIHPSGIYGCLKKTRKTAGGFSWLWEEETRNGQRGQEISSLR